MTMRTRMRILPSADEEQPSGGEATTKSGAGAPAVFVVDDDPGTLDLLCEVAREAGWEARPFTRLVDLRASLNHLRPTLLILDDDLPDGRGGDFARELRNDERLADTPMLVCTAAHPIRQAEIGSWAPVVSKPFDLREIDAFLDAAARRRPQADDLGERAG